MQQRKTPEDFYNEDTGYISPVAQDKPYQEQLPKAFNRPPEPARFDEPVVDWTRYYWMYVFFMVGLILTGMGIAALLEMFKSYSWLLALSWTSTAVLGIGGLALIQKYWIRQ